jgi:hypothetical protein
MFKPYKNGTFTDIDYEGSKGPIRVYIPPEGYVLDQFPKSDTYGQMIRVPTLFVSEKPINQKWKRETYPDSWKKYRKEEKRIQQSDPAYSNPELDDFRYRQWSDRYNGVWIAVWDPYRRETEKIYLTGMHWLYLQWWRCDFGYPDFRYIDLEVFYLLQYAIEDPDSMGIILATLRRFGKTAILGLWNFEYISRTRNAYSGLQSTTKEDAKKVFTLSIVYPWKYLPDFFRPIYDYNSTQQSDLVFKTPTPKGKSQLLIDAEDSRSLHSYLSYRDAGIYSYDGYKLHRVGMEEPGKSPQIRQRHQVLIPTMKRGKAIIGKCFAPTTVEEGVGEEFVELWHESHFGDKDPEGTNRTKSGLYNHFIPAYNGYIFDQYGRSVVDDPPDDVEIYDPETGARIKRGAKTELRHERANLRDDREAYNAHIRKYPFTIREALRITSKECLFDEDKLNERIDVVSWSPNLFTRGNFMWLDGIRDSSVYFEEFSNGRWLLAIDPTSMKRVNAVRKIGDRFQPLNDEEFATGLDPYEHKYTSSNKLSSAASYVLKKHDPYDESQSMKFVSEYINRPQGGPAFVYEDMIMQCVFFGCSVLVEDNKPGVIEYFERRGYGEFLMWLPGSRKPGMSAPNNSDTKQYWTEIIDSYIHSHYKKMIFIRQMEDLIKFDINDTQMFDASMATGYTLIAARNRVFEMKKKPEVKDSKYVDKIFRKYKLKKQVA